jgi:hypothetical protein
MKRFNPTVVTIGSLLLLLVAVDSLANRGGRLGQYSADHTFIAYSNKPWSPPAESFRSAGCCVDDIRSATWNGARLTLHTTGANIPLFLDSGMHFPARPVPGGSDLLAVAYSKDRIWVPEKLHQRLLEVKLRGEYETQIGSNAVGPVNGVAVTCADPVTLVLTTGARNSMGQFLLQQAPPADASEQEKLYLSRSGLSPPTLVQLTPSDNSVPVRLNIGDDLSAPSGLALSTDGKTLYVADEREDELAWLKLVQTGNASTPWASRGKLARFRLDASQHGLVRGLVVLNYEGQDILAGATPGGLEFLTPDGHRLGAIQTNEQISSVIRGQRGKDALLYVVAGRNIWQANLSHVAPMIDVPCAAAGK